jgi:hypothetical protein
MAKLLSKQSNCKNQKLSLYQSNRILGNIQECETLKAWSTRSESLLVMEEVKVAQFEFGDEYLQARIWVGKNVPGNIFLPKQSCDLFTSNPVKRHPVKKARLKG